MSKYSLVATAFMALASHAAHAGPVEDLLAQDQALKARIEARAF